jgi:predicted HD phosphohydrolase
MRAPAPPVRRHRSRSRPGAYAAAAATRTLTAGPFYDSLPLEFFRPIVEEVLSTPRHAVDDLAFVRGRSAD